MELGEQLGSSLSRLVTLITFCNPTDSHAYLTLALHWVEPGEYMVPVVVHYDAQMWQLQVQGKAGAWVKPKLASLISAGAIRIQGGRGGKPGIHNALSHEQHTPTCSSGPTYLCVSCHTNRGAITFIHVHLHRRAQKRVSASFPEGRF